MHRIYKALVLLTLVRSGLVPASVLAQIAPLPYAPVPAQPQDSSGAGGREEPSRNQPNASIQGWSFGNELQPEVMGKGREIQLEPGAHDLVIFFNSAPNSSASVEFRYSLIGYDSDWSVTRNSIAHYRNLPPGRYRFIVQSHTPGQPWSAPSAELAVVQRRFFYQTWYFYLLLFAALIALTIELLRQRDQLLKGQIGVVLNERQRIASDCHDTLMVGLAAISWQLEATAKLLVGSDDRTLRAIQSCDLTRKMVSHCQAEARRIIWDLRESDEITDTLSHALSRALAANCHTDKIDILFDVEGPEIPLPPAAVHHLVCIGQEAVNNSVRHSGASRIQVLLCYGSDSLNLTIRDDGCGFHPVDTGIRSMHFGVSVMQERTRKLGGSFHLNTSPGMGTEIFLKIDFHALHSLIDTKEQLASRVGVH